MASHLAALRELGANGALLSDMLASGDETWVGGNC